MLSKKLSVFSYRLYEFLSLGRVDFKWSTFHKIKVFFSSIWVTINCLSSIPGAFDVISLNNLLVGVEYIGHDDKIYPTDDLTFLIFF